MRITAIENVKPGMVVGKTSTIIKLNTGEIAVIVKSYKDFATRPQVRILTDKNGQKITAQPTIELINNLTYFIVKVVDDFN
ncbi:MAG: hypothetical protein WC834_03500 [Eubacteriales bacterium]